MEEGNTKYETEDGVGSPTRTDFGVEVLLGSPWDPGVPGKVIPNVSTLHGRRRQTPEIINVESVSGRMRVKGVHH